MSLGTEDISTRPQNWWTFGDVGQGQSHRSPWGTFSGCRSRSKIIGHRICDVSRSQIDELSEDVGQGQRSLRCDEACWASMLDLLTRILMTRGTIYVYYGKSPQTDQHFGL